MTANINADFFGLVADDLNGECFILGGEGEVEKLVENNIVLIPDDFPVAGAFGNAVAVNQDQANKFIAMNALTSHDLGRTIPDAARIAYIRLLAVRNGLMSPSFDTVANHVKYNHCQQVNDVDTNQNLIDFNDEAKGPFRDGLKNTLTAAVRKNLRELFSDMVCCVAYMFRVRGHHYKDDFRDRYTTLWARCLHNETDLGISWELIATDALHAIMPVHLDDYWAFCVTESRCAGTLGKRFDSAPAGVAGLLALSRGLDDVRMLFPGVVSQVPEAYEFFRRLVVRVRNSRWGGSINSRYYGADRIRFDESQIGALASVVMGVYDSLAPDSKLRESPALRRLAETAPVTGGAIGLAARRTVQSEAMTLIGATIGNENQITQ